VETYSYSRKYTRGSYLRAHADRPSCEVSATICLDYQSDDNEPWVIWVDNTRNWVDEDISQCFDETQGIPIRHRKSIPVKLEVGDLLLYQGPNVVHWRDTFIGNHSYHMFLHFVTDYVSNLGAVNNEKTNGMFRVQDSDAYGDVRMVLANDGRPNRYVQSDDSTVERQEMERWSKVYESLHGQKHRFVNNYDQLEFEKIEE